jgi:hypothetical protein
LCGCIFGPQADKPKMLCSTKLLTGERIKISYSDNPDNRLFRILLRKDGALVDHFEITDIPNKIIIDKLILSEKGSRSVYRMVSDSSRGNFKSLDFSFQRQTWNSTTSMSDFISLSSKDKLIMDCFITALLKNDFGLKFTSSDLDKMIGWVRVYY